MIFSGDTEIVHLLEMGEIVLMSFLHASSGHQTIPTLSRSLNRD